MKDHENIRHIRARWARLVSDVLSPPVVWAVLAFPIAFKDAHSPEQALLWAVVYGLMVCLVPVVFIGYMVWRGHISDMHMQHRKQRVWPFLVSILCTGFAWWVLRWLGAPPLMPLFALFAFVQMIVMALITLIWQISMHAMSITGATITTNLLFGFVPALLTIPLVLLVGAARLNLKRHTPAQILAGALVGALVPALVLFAK
jgi:hypothetical protein